MKRAKKQKTDIARATQENGPIRFQVSAPEGGEVETALRDILAQVPPALRSGLSIGSLFRQVMIDNDAQIAAMIRASMEQR